MLFLEKRKSLFFYFRSIYVLYGIAILLINYLFLINGVHHSYTPLRGLFNSLNLFTIQTNLLVILWGLSSILHALGYRRSILLSDSIRGGILVYISATFLVFLLYLRNVFDLSGYRYIIHLSTHYVIPISYILDWSLTERGRVYSWKNPLYWLFYPFIFLILHMVYAYVFDGYVYPFLDIKNIGISLFSLSLCGGTLFFLLLGFFYTFINKYLQKPFK